MTPARAALAAYAFALLTGLVASFAVPIWSRLDEPQHADYISRLAHGRYPKVDDPVSSEIYAVMRQTGVYTGDLPGAGPVPRIDPPGFGPPPPLTGEARYAWFARHLWEYSYEAAQPPLYYLVAVPAWVFGDRVAGPLAAVRAVRILDVLLGALVAPLAVGVLQALSTLRGWAPLPVAALAALLPEWFLVAGQVGNDALVAVLGGACCLLAVRGAAGGWRLRAAAATGLLLGSAIATKVTAAGLFPAVMLALCLPRPEPRRLLVAAVGGAVPLLPWVAANLVRYGSLTPAGAAQSQAAIPLPALSPGLIVGWLIHMFASFWGGEPAFTLPLAPVAAVLAALLSVLAVAGLIRLARRPRPELLVALLAVAGVGALALATPELARAGFLPPGRYLFPALAPALALFWLGLRAEVPWPRPRTAAAGLLLAVQAAILGSLVLGLELPPKRGSGQPPASASARPVGVSAAVGGLAVTVDSVAVDASRDDVWVHLRLVNKGPGFAEWSAKPVLVAAGGTAGLTDYARSAPLPSALDAGAGAEGWMVLHTGRPPASLGSSFLRLSDVAAGSYSEVRTIDLPVPLG